MVTLSVIYGKKHLSHTFLSATLAYHKLHTMNKVNQLMNDAYALLMNKQLSAFNKDGDFDYSQFEDSSGIHKGELLFLLLLTHFSDTEEYEKCANIVNIRKEFRAKFGKDEVIELKYKD